MEESTKILYREVQERCVKVIWMHKIQQCQADIYLKRNYRRNIWLTVLSVLVSAAAVTNILKWIPEVVIVPILALLSLTLTFFTIKYKTDNLGKAAAENEHFAAIMHNLRNRYTGLLSEIKAGLLTNTQIVEKRDILEKEENLIYLGTVPTTSVEAVEAAERALKTNQDSTTTDDEIELLISKNLR